jgi:multiple sugar transport system permease protein
MKSNIPESLQIKPKKTGRFSLNFWQREVLAFYGFVTPWILGFIALSIIPLAFAVIISFTNFSGFDFETTSFIGISNYAEAIRNPIAYRSFLLTCQYTALSVPIGMVVALGLALLLNTKIPARGFFRTLYYLPTMVPGVATALVFQTILNTNSGFINLFISILAGRGTVIDWVNNYGIGCLVVMGVWGCGTTMVIFLAGLQGIPEELQEAARIDGANKWQVFRHITWPLLSPITYFQFMMGIIGSLQMFFQAGVLSQASGGNFWNPLQSLFVYPAYALSQMLSYQRFGYGTALIWILFVIILIFAVFVQRTSKHWVFYAVEQGKGGKEE